MDYNMLQGYLTELGSGPWPRFRAALEYLAHDDEALYPSARARDLSMLGHVDFAFQEDLRWSVCPPALAWLPRTDECVAVLCGARTQKHLDGLAEQARELAIDLRVRQQADGPDAVFVQAPSGHAGNEFAACTGLASEHDVAERIAHCLPPLDSYAQLCLESPEPSGYAIQTLDTDSLTWVEVSRSDGEGLYRYDCYRPEFRLKADGRCLKTPGEIGAYLLLRRRQRNVLRYTPESGDLLVPVRTRLPDLFARAATLASGLLPDFARLGEVPTHVYRQVPAAVAEAILVRLGQSPS